MRTRRRRGFNAAKKGSGQVGFQAAEPVHPEVPSAIDEGLSELLTQEQKLPLDGIDDYYEGMYEKMQELTDIDTGLTLKEQMSVAEAREKLATTDPGALSWSDESVKISEAMSGVWGLKKSQYSEAHETTAAQVSFSAGGHFDFLDRDEAVREVRGLVEEAPFYGKVDEKFEETIASIENGELLVTSNDITQLRAFRDEAYTIHSRDNTPEHLQPLDAEWVSSAVLRKCELCGEFIGTRDSHGSFQSNEVLYAGVALEGRRVSDRGYTICEDANRGRRMKEINNSLIRAAAVRDPKSFIVGPSYSHRFISPLREDEVNATMFAGMEDWVEPSMLDVNPKKVSEYSPELLEDAYMSGYMSAEIVGATHIRDNIIALYADKRGVGGKKTVFTVPQNIREAIVEAPPFTQTGRASEPETSFVRNNSMILLASRIEPPFTESEIKRMIDRGDAGVASAFLYAKRTSGTARQILANYPSVSGWVMARRGMLPADLLSEMASSGDPEVRAYAASAPNIHVDDVSRLAEDTDVRVRRTLIIPETVDNFNTTGRATEDPGEITVEKGRAYYAQASFPAPTRVEPSRWFNGTYVGSSALRRHTDKVGEALINDPDPEVAGLAFKSVKIDTYIDEYNGRGVLGTRDLSLKQKYLVSRIHSRTRFNEIKRIVLEDPEGYPANIPDVARLIAY